MALFRTKMYFQLCFHLISNLFRNKRCSSKTAICSFAWRDQALKVSFPHCCAAVCWVYHCQKMCIYPLVSMQCLDKKVSYSLHHDVPLCDLVFHLLSEASHALYNYLIDSAWRSLEKDIICETEFFLQLLWCKFYHLRKQISETSYF